MPSLADLKRLWLLRMLGVSSTEVSEADLETELYADPSYLGGVRRVAIPAIRSGQYFFPSAQSSIAGIATSGNEVLRLYPIILSNPLSLSAIGAETTVVGEAGSKFRLGVYADDGTGQPGALVLDAGQINGDAVAVQELVVDVDVDAGLYWIGGAVQAAPVTQPTLRALGGANGIGEFRIQSAAVPGASAIYYGYIMNAVPGALPAAFVNDGIATTTIARLFLKAA